MLALVSKNSYIFPNSPNLRITSDLSKSKNHLCVLIQNTQLYSDVEVNALLLSNCVSLSVTQEAEAR